MSRVGFPPRAARSAAERIVAMPGIRLVALMTHFADSDAADPRFTLEQLAQFESVVQNLRDAGIGISLRHAANSAALIRHPGARLDLVRPGIMLYGCSPCAVPRPDDPVLVPRSGSAPPSATSRTSPRVAGELRSNLRGAARYADCHTAHRLRRRPRPPPLRAGSRLDPRPARTDRGSCLHGHDDGGRHPAYRGVARGG